MGEAYGQFDTIIAHGVYSWTPEPVREALLRLGASLLRPDGLFYLSYNVAPGCRPRQMLRDILKYATRDADSPAASLALAGAVLKAYEPVWAKGEPLEVALAEEARIMLERDRPKAFIMTNSATFMRRTCSPMSWRRPRRWGSTICATPCRMLSAPAFFPELSEPGAAQPDRIELEQRSDFATLRQFRRSVFCFGGAVDCKPDPKKLKTLWARGEFTREAGGRRCRRRTK